MTASTRESSKIHGDFCDATGRGGNQIFWERSGVEILNARLVEPGFRA